MKKVILLLLFLSLTGCTSIEISPYGPDTYKGVSEGIDYQIASSYGLNEANSYCVNMGKIFLPVSSETFTDSDSKVNYDLTFRCLDEDDPELTRPNMEKVPDLIIENR